MKKIICLLSVIIMCTIFASCGRTNQSDYVVTGSVKSVDDVLSEEIKNIDSSGRTEKKTSVPFKRTIPVDELPAGFNTLDVDLTTMNSTMVYSEVSNMMTSPEKYMGKKVKMSGTFTYGTGDNRYYFACLIADATACCSQGIEFILKNDRAFPYEYPAVGDKITVVGIFDTYYEGTNRYCQLIDAYMQ